MQDSDIENLYLNFSYFRNLFGTIHEVELIKDGKTIDVNAENKKEYVKALAQMKMTYEIS